MAETILKYNYNSELEGYEVIGYDSIANDGILIIPDTYNGKPVVKIVEKDFYTNSNITHLTIGENISEIGYSAFSYCNNLETVTGGSKTGLKIGYATFEACEKLKEVNLSNSLKEIHGDAFRNCTSLENFIIPNSI